MYLANCGFSEREHGLKIWLADKTEKTCDMSNKIRKMDGAKLKKLRENHQENKIHR